jgi:hypothetical protein
MTFRHSLCTPAQTQFSFNPADYCFGWTTGATPADDWYTWDSKLAHQAARAGRDKAMRAFKAKGHQVKAYSSPGSLISRGGIGSGHPHIEHVVTVYGFNVINPNYS